MIIPPLKTARLELRSLGASDASDRYVGWLNDPEVNRYLEVRFVTHTAEDVIDFIEAANQHPGTILLGMFKNEDERHIGNIKLGPINPHHHHADISLFIGERAEWGKGFATESILALTDFALGGLGLHKVQAGCYSGNTGSYNAFLKAGYSDVARLKEHWWCNGHWEDECLLEKLK